jgi:hypothetical protein
LRAAARLQARRGRGTGGRGCPVAV